MNKFSVTKINTVISIFLVAIGVLFFSRLYLERELIFDDAFITFRYSRHLSQGLGIRWNQADPPLEGYTNFLFMALCSIAFYLKMDPLIFARFANLLATFGIIFLIYRLVRQNFKASFSEAILLAGGFLLVPDIPVLIMSGIETLFFTFLLLYSLDTTVRLRNGSTLLNVTSAAVIQFLSFLTRPESLLFTLSASLYMLTGYFCSTHLDRETRKNETFTFITIFGIFFLSYLFWKQLYFGSILPTSFYIKASNPSLISEYGSGSVCRFYWKYSLLLVLFLTSFSYYRKQNVLLLRLSLSFIILWTIFFIHVDTLMDIGGRFLFPLTPFLYLGITPTIQRTLASLVEIKNTTISIVFALLVLTISFAGNIKSTISDVIKAKDGQSNYSNKNELMQKEYLLGLRMQSYPSIRNVSIAFGDAGVIPFFTDAPNIDTVGLNNFFISRERNLEKLTDYFFSTSPDLILTGTQKDGSSITYGHGPLGNATLWDMDPRWCQYTYVGTALTDYYNINFLVQNGYSHFHDLRNFIQQHLVDSTDMMPHSFGIVCKKSVDM
jgi:arabinofuranosyltransferase